MRYFPQKIEEKWRKWWLKNRTYEPDFSSRSANRRKPFYNLMMFPYPSAEGLHIGSVRTFSGIDIYGRLKRMQGYDLFEPIGLDGFGIHSENYALKVGKHPFRHAKDSEKNFYRQLGTIGNGFAWEERLETYNPLYYKWTQWIFVQMFKRGLAYRKKSPVNWCPSCKTVLADEQVLHGECERCQSKVVKKDLEQWFFRITKYADRLLKNLDNLPDRQAGIDWPEPIKIAQKNWIGKSEGAEISFPLKLDYNYVLLHGYTGNSEGIFFPWLKNQLKKRGFKFFAPDLPNTKTPSEKEQVDFVLENAKFDENTILFGHSLGAAVALKVAEKLKGKIAGLVLAGGFVNTNFRDHKRPFDKTFSWKFDFQKIMGNTGVVTVLSDPNDYAIPLEQGRILADRLKGNLIEKGAQEEHFTGKEEPIILENLIPSLKIFTTRPDTLFGATYMVLGPEHRLISKIKYQISNFKEVEEYIKKAKVKTDEERIAEGKEKTGIELKGVKTINPANGEEIPVWVADYVLGNVGTGAIMAVPAHDERDWEFAKKYKLSIKQVVAEETGIKRQKEERRDGAFAVIFDPAKQKYAVGYHKDGFFRLFSGGTDEGESTEKGILREVQEESGLYDFTYTEKIGTIFAHYRHPRKNVNRFTEADGFLIVLKSDKLKLTQQDEHEKFTLTWATPEEIMKNWEAWGIEIDHWRSFFGRSIGRAIELGFDKKSDMRKYKNSGYTGTGKLINSEKFSEMDSEKAKGEITKFVGGTRKVNYRLRDWLISRQRYWGPPIPIVYCRRCWQIAIRQRRSKSQIAKLQYGKDYAIFDGEEYMIHPVPEKDLPVKLPKVKNFRPTGTSESPLASIKSFYQAKCPKCKSPARRETDVSDTFLDSAWYYLRYPSVRMKNSKIKMKNGNAKSKISEIPWNREITQKWLPVDMYIGGAEHAVLHLLYVRFLAMAFYDWKLIHFEEPFKKFRTHGLITKDGAKMSKSKGNIVNPDEYINAYGSDAIRMYLAFLAPLPQGGDFRDEGIKGVTRFLERVWRFFEETKDEGRKTKALVVSRSSLVRLIHKTIKKVTEDLESFQYNTAISALMILLNTFEENPDAVTKEDIKIFLKLLAPLAPHISEELWQQIADRNPPTAEKIANSKYQSIHLESWPKYNPKLIEEETFELVIQVNGKVRGKVTLPRGTSEEEAKKEALKKKEILRYLPQGPKKTIFVQNKLINFVA